jgi:amino acid transporter
MGEEIVDARRTVPRAVIVSAVVIAALYIVGTLSILLALPPDQISGLQGLVQAMQAIARRSGVPWLVPVVAALVVVNVLGAVAGWFAATARLPFVAGVDRFLPEVFGRLHPRWQTPHVALHVQAALAAVFIVLGQAGTSVRGAYDALVSLSIIAQFIPYLFMFAAMAVLQREPAGPEVIRAPGGAPVARLLGAVGFVVSVATIGLACVPAADDPNKTLAVIKIVGGSAALVGAGALVYFLGKRRS